MDENSCSKLKDHHHQMEASWIPSTPAKPGLGEEKLIHSEQQQQGVPPPPPPEIWSQQTPSDGGTIAACCGQSNSVPVTRYFDNLKASDATESQSYEDTINEVSIENSDKWNNAPLKDLLLHVMARGTAKGSRSSARFQTIPINSSMENQSHFLEPRLHHVPETPCRENTRGFWFPFDLNTLPRTTADASTAGISSHFAPITPNQFNKTDKVKVSTPPPDLSMDATAKDTEGKEVAESFEPQNNQSELVENQSSTTISPATGENFEPVMGIDQQSDRSKTQVKKPRRRKHRPKVIVEGQSKKTRKRTPKPAGLEEVLTPKRKYVRRGSVNKTVDAPLEGKTNGTAAEAKPPGSEDMPRSKRKYVKRKRVDQSTTPFEDVNTITTVSRASRVTRSSCKKSLNFDIENQEPDRSSSQLHSDLEAEYHWLSSGQQQSQSTIKLGQQEMGVLVEKTEAGIAHDLTRSMSHVFKDYLLVGENQAPCINTQQHGKLMVSDQNESTRGKCQIVFSDVTHDKEASIFKMMTSDHSNCSSSESLGNETMARGPKRRRVSTSNEAEPFNINAAGTHYNSLQAYQEIIQANEYNKEGTPSMHFPAIFKKKRTEIFHKSASFSILPVSITTDYCGRHFMYASNEAFTSETAFEISAPHCDARRSQTSGTPVDGTQNQQNTCSCLPTMGNAEKLRKKRSKGHTRVRDFASLQKSIRPLPTTSRYCMTTSEVLQGHHTCMDALADIQATLTTKKRSSRILVSSTSPDTYNHHQSATNSRGSPQSIMCKDPIDAIIEKLNCLDIKAKQNPLVAYQVDNPCQNSMVVYQSNGAMVPVHIRRRRSRPKVDLDNETSRVWKLLLENINSEGIDGTDEEKKKQWEKEREVFHLRTESFIARMHQVQGDRRFTPWKGSVVDSVIGVFLTQNVSDHLSSSAFMSMAARFPLKTRNHHHTESGEKKSERAEELVPNDGSEGHKKVSSPPEGVNSKSFFGDTSEGHKTQINPRSLSLCTSEDVNRLGSRNSEMLAALNGDQGELDDAISSQSSVVSPHNSVDSIGQTANISEPCSQSSSEAEPTDGACGPTSFVELLQMQGTGMLHGFYNQGSRKAASCFGIIENQDLGDINTSKDSRSFDISKENELSVTEQSGLSAESSEGASYQNTFALGFGDLLKLPIENSHSLNNHQIPIEDKEIELVPNVESQESHRLYEESNGPSSSGCVLDNSGRKISMDKARNQMTVEPNLSDEMNPNKSVPKRRKTNQKEQKKAFDWDSLRKQVLANGKKERTVETMDSVDWEAVRCADVEVIAQTIKERGMNNMLAERIKAFLNRIVTQHESIDLEWIREIPPDTAKDFLLSVRGLGLKSVECVRLLTLHHLAFPVDTNVGRIAVRLGWVPLQPLPESLQLHLLELYPVLESIQKYLWPRLCKLDQRTLYELHYQMITFGKVFCTKSKPNCNACPMRAECRHFASAYASARLALPAPEERRIINATENESPNRNPAEKINHLQLPQPQTNQQLEASSQVKTFGPIIEEPATPEPIIEEPATPEPEQIQVADIDIEDVFHEDPNEIPTIRLNLEEFNQNLQNYIQQNIQVAEGEMSKALVVLNAAAASIPIPKLKNISRLRTEHQVYELPDTHPLLQGLDKRESDDPSHYLLAIWTPGETVDSIRPPESSCSFQESGKLCDRETCFSCNSIREANSQTVRGTILIPCRTAMRGSFPLNGTYFQVNEMFADHESSLHPIDVPRNWLWNLTRRTVYFGTSVPTIFKGLSQPEIQYCFWRGFVCVRGFDRKTRAPRPLIARLHFPASKLSKKDE